MHFLSTELAFSTELDNLWIMICAEYSVFLALCVRQQKSKRVVDVVVVVQSQRK